jgi:hypothetical protein
MLYKFSGISPTVTAGASEPTITGIADVPADQGGFVRIDWFGCATDREPINGISTYRVWRQAVATIPAAPASSVRAQRVASAAASPGRAAALDGDPPTWDLMATVTATDSTSYSAVVPTQQISASGSKPYEQFLVVATDRTTGDLYASPPDSGYSVDNWPPYRPNPVAAIYSPEHGSMELRWDSTHEPDLLNFRLYRDLTPGFVPSLGNLIAILPDTGYVYSWHGQGYYHYVDTPGTSPAYYQITGVDIHGNESTPSCFSQDAPTAVLVSLVSAVVDQGQVRIEWTTSEGAGLGATVYRRTDVTAWAAVGRTEADGSGRLTHVDQSVMPGQRYGYRLGIQHQGAEVFAGDAWVDVPPAVLALEGARPNPVAGVSGLVHFTLPSAVPAQLEVVDVSGRLVSVRDVGSLGPGVHAVVLGAGSPLAPGVYVIRLTQGSSILTKRVVVVR